MELGISGRVAMIAAASKGLGRASAEALAREGCRLSLCARSTDELAATCQALGGLGAEVFGEPADVSRAEDLERWVERTSARFGGVDILVTNTGGPPAARFLDLKEEQWREGIDSTLLNVVRLCRLVAPRMAARGWGRMIHLTSFVAREPEDDLTISATLRAGISALTRTLARQLGPSGITVNAVLPGHALTDRQKHLAELRSRAQGTQPDEYLRRAAEKIPLGRIADPREIGEVVAFLASERASYLSGVSLPVDGGLLRGTF
jgi:3-oxoacyl-[acyl-carrier protein] reductase